MSLYNNVIRNTEKTESWMEEEDYNILDRIKNVNEAFLQQQTFFGLPLEKVGEGVFDYRVAGFKSWDEFTTAWKEGSIGKEWLDKEIDKAQAIWNILPDGGKKGIIKGLEFVGDTYQDLRTIDEHERFDASAYVTAGTLRTLEGVGWLTNFLIGKPVSFVAHKGLGLDERIADATGLAADVILGSKGLTKLGQLRHTGKLDDLINLTKKGVSYVDEATAGLRKVDAAKRTITIKDYSSIIDDTFSQTGDVFRNNLDTVRPRAFFPKNGSSSKYWYSDGDLNLRKGGILDRHRNDTNKFLFAEDSMGDYLGRKKNETYPDFSRRILTTYGARPDKNGLLVMSSEAFAAIKNPNVRREIAQLLLTDINQGVKGSFLQQSKIKNKKLNKDLEAYNKKYGARADLHHGYPSVIGIEFYLDNPHMGDQWHKYQAIAAKYGNVPGQPMVEGKDNLISLPSSIPSTITKRKSGITRDNPAYVEAKEGLEKEGRKIPQHLHQIIHDSFLTNEMGQSGKKFWEKWDPIIIQKGEAGWLEAYEAFNEIIARNRAMYNEALAQLDIFFSKANLTENPEKLVDLLEEYIAKGKITIGQGLVRDKSGNVVITQEGTDTALSTMKFVEYQQDAVQYIVEDALRDFKEHANKLLENDPRLKDVAAEVATIPGLTQAEIELAEELLFKIKWYNSIFLTDGKSRAYQVTRISAEQHRRNINMYHDLIQLKLPIEIPKSYIQLKTFSKMKLPSISRQLELIFDEQLELNLDD